MVMTLMQVFNSHSSTDGRLGDYCDGTQFKECALFCEDPCALQIQLYYDEVDVCNEIGSKSTVHKLGMSDALLLLQYRYQNMWFNLVYV